MKLILLLFLSASAAFSRSEREMGERPKLDMEKTAHYIIFFTNIERTYRRLPILQYNPILQKGSVIHSRYMAENRVMSHSENVLRNPADRVRAACGENTEECMKKFEPKRTGFGSFHICCGENVITSLTNNTAGISYYINKDEKGEYKEWENHDTKWFNEESLAADMVKRWMNSPGHRANILNPEYSTMGAAVDFSAEADYYYGTQVFSPHSEGHLDYDGFEVGLKTSEDGVSVLTVNSGEKLKNGKLRFLCNDKVYISSRSGSEHSLAIPKNLKEEMVFSIQIGDRRTDYWYPHWKIRVFPEQDKIKWEWKAWEY